MTLSKTVWTKLLFVLVLGFAVSACDSDDPDEDGPGEEELITRVTVTLTPAGGGSAITVSANDPDGDGTNFQIDDLTLSANTTYTGSIEVSDEINGEDITEEIEEEADEHQFFFFPGGGVANLLTVTATDLDGNGLPVGLAFSLVVGDGASSSGTLRVVLSHYDEGPKDGVTQSDESDFDISFPVDIN